MSFNIGSIVDKGFSVLQQGTSLTKRLSLEGFYHLPKLAYGKTIQSTYKFEAYFLPIKVDKEVIGEIGPMPIMMPWMVKSIRIPEYVFKGNTVQYGHIPRSFPTLDYSEPLKLSIDFEEDDNGTALYFIKWLQRTIIDRNGYFRPAAKSKVGYLVVEVYDQSGIPTTMHVFKNIYYLSSSSPSYDYGTDGAVAYTVEFGCDQMFQVFTKKIV